MSRTDIDVDDDLVAQVLALHGLRTEREAVDFALRRLLRAREPRRHMAKR